jgi:hypothetical protein
MYLAGYQLFNQVDINTDAVGDPTGADIVYVELRHNTDLLLQWIVALPGIAIGWRWGAGVGGLGVH